MREVKGKCCSCKDKERACKQYLTCEHIVCKKCFNSAVCKACEGEEKCINPQTNEPIPNQSSKGKSNKQLMQMSEDESDYFEKC